MARLLAGFRPTRVAVERRHDDEETLEREFRAYRNGEFELPPGEVYQLGFRVARACGHDRLHPVDEWGRLYGSWDEMGAHCADLLGLPDHERSSDELQAICLEALSGGRAVSFQDLLDEREEALVRESLRRYLLRVNSRGSVNFSHGIYLSWVDSPPGDHVLVDHVTGWWYNRNLRIFGNIKRLIGSPDERILVIIGEGHLPILRHAVESSWDMDLVEVETYLGRGGDGHS